MRIAPSTNDSVAPFVATGESPGGAPNAPSKNGVASEADFGVAMAHLSALASPSLLPAKGANLAPVKGANADGAASKEATKGSGPTARSSSGGSSGQDAQAGAASRGERRRGTHTSDSAAGFGVAFFSGSALAPVAVAAGSSLAHAKSVPSETASGTVATNGISAHPEVTQGATVRHDGAFVVSSAQNSPVPTIPNVNAAATADTVVKSSDSRPTLGAQAALVNASKQAIQDSRNTNATPPPSAGTSSLAVAAGEQQGALVAPAPGGKRVNHAGSTGGTSRNKTVSSYLEHANVPTPADGNVSQTSALAQARPKPAAQSAVHRGLESVSTNGPGARQLSDGKVVASGPNAEFPVSGSVTPGVGRTPTRRSLSPGLNVPAQAAHREHNKGTTDLARPLNRQNALQLPSTGSASQPEQTTRAAAALAPTAPRADYPAQFHPGKLASLNVALAEGHTAHATIREKSGSIDVKIIAPDASAAQRISGEMDTLRSALNGAGLKLRAAQVNYRSDSHRGEGQRRNFSHQRNSGNRDSKAIFSVQEVRE